MENHRRSPVNAKGGLILQAVLPSPWRKPTLPFPSDCFSGRWVMCFRITFHDHAMTLHLLTPRLSSFSYPTVKAILPSLAPFHSSSSLRILIRSARTSSFALPFLKHLDFITDVQRVPITAQSRETSISHQARNISFLITGMLSHSPRRTCEISKFN